MANTKISALTAADALDGTEEFPVVQDGETKGATIDQIAESTALTGTFAALDEPLTIPAAPAAAVISATPGFLDSWPTMAFSATVDNYAAYNFRLPSAWTSIKVDLWWMAASSGAGNAVWSYNVRDGVAGGGNNTSLGSGTVTAATGGSKVFVVTPLIATLSVTPNHILTLVLGRNGSDAVTDTLGVASHAAALVITPLA